MRIYFDRQDAREGGDQDGYCAIDHITDVELVYLNTIMGAVADDAEISPLARRFADAFFEACERLAVQVADGVAEPFVYLRIESAHDPDVVTFRIDDGL